MSWLKQNKQNKIQGDKTNKGNKSLSVFSAIKEVIAGDVFLRDIFQRQFLLILLLTFFGLMYINNRFLYERELRELQQKREELADLEKRSITIQRDLKRSGRRSIILEALHNQGSDLEENDTPVIIID